MSDISSITTEEEQQLADAFARLQADYVEPVIQTQSGETLSDGDTDESDDSDEEEVEDEEEPEESEEDGAEGDEDEEDDIDLGNGQIVSRSELAKLAELQRLIDPATRAVLEQTSQIPAPAPPTQSLPSVPAPLEPPVGLDLDDPSIKVLWDGYVALHENQQRIHQEQTSRQQQEAVEQVERAVSDWGTRYKLDDTTLQSVRLRAGQTNVAGALVSSGKSVYEATNAALEQAFWSEPTLRSQYLTAAAADEAARAKTQRAKTRKLSALSGRGTSTGGNKPPSEMTREERREAMTRDIAEHLARN